MPSSNPLIKDVVGDGSCFFRAMYYSAQAANLLPRVVKCFGGDPKSPSPITEVGFVRLARMALSHAIRNKKDATIIHESYQVFKALSKEDYKIMLNSSFPSWFQRAFAKLPSTEQEYREGFAKHTLSLSSWVSELEVHITKAFLAKCKIQLHVFNKQGSPRRFKDYKSGVIYLLNQNEIHYNSVLVTLQQKKKQIITPTKQTAKTCPEGKILNPLTNRCLLQHSCKGYEVQFKQLIGEL